MLLRGQQQTPHNPYCGPQIFVSLQRNTKSSISMIHVSCSDKLPNYLQTNNGHCLSQCILSSQVFGQVSVWSRWRNLLLFLFFIYIKSIFLVHRNCRQKRWIVLLIKSLHLQKIYIIKNIGKLETSQRATRWRGILINVINHYMYIN